MSMRAAINAKCKDCIYDPLCGGGNWKQQVEACTIQTCALWPYRPKSRPRTRKTPVNRDDLSIPAIPPAG